MVTLNSRGEVADFLDVSQFVPSRSAYECVAYSASLIKFAGLPNHGPTGTAIQASNLAQFWYGRLEGGTDTANKNGMSLDAEYTMLQGMGLHYQALTPSVAAIRTALAAGTPVMMCGAETGMYDLLLGDRIPYGWTPTGNHCVVVSGFTSDGNPLVHDCASIDGNGNVRPGPRPYDASKLQLVSATAIQLVPASQGDDLPMLQLTDPMGQYFTQIDANHWHCTPTNVDLIYGHLAFYRQYGGMFGLPRTNEIYLAQLPGTAIMVYERAIAIYDPSHKYDNPPGAGPVYLMHIDSGIGQQLIAKPLLAALQAQVSQLQAQLAQDTSAELQAQLASYQAAVKQVDALMHPLAV